MLSGQAESELKRARAAWRSTRALQPKSNKALLEEEQGRQGQGNKKGKGVDKNAGASAGTGGIEEELAVNASEDYELEQMKDVAEAAMTTLRTAASAGVGGEDTAVLPVTLLALFPPLLTAVCSQPRKYERVKWGGRGLVHEILLHAHFSLIYFYLSFPFAGMLITIFSPWPRSL